MDDGDLGVVSLCVSKRHAMLAAVFVAAPTIIRGVLEIVREVPVGCAFELWVPSLGFDQANQHPPIVMMVNRLLFCFCPL